MSAPSSCDPHAGYRGGLVLPGWDLVHRGKVRDLYRHPEHPAHLLMIASDRLSAFDVTMAETVPDRGRVLTHVTEYWLREVESLIPAARVSIEPGAVPDLPEDFHDLLRGRLTWTRRAERVNVEIVLRAYLAGSGWREYAATGRLWEHELPAGLQKSSRLPAILHTPTTKDAQDRPITWAEAVALIGDATTATTIRDTATSLFERAERRAAAAGVVLADTKFEFGRIDGQLVLIDEVFTPDCSRYWPADQIVVGEEPPSYDKEIVRAYLRSQKDWNRQPPPPPIPDEVIARTRARYLEICTILTGSLPPGVED